MRWLAVLKGDNEPPQEENHPQSPPQPPDNHLISSFSTPSSSSAVLVEALRALTTTGRALRAKGGRRDGVMAFHQGLAVS